MPRNRSASLPATRLGPDHDRATQTSAHRNARRPWASAVSTTPARRWPIWWSFMTPPPVSCARSSALSFKTAGCRLRATAPSIPRSGSPRRPMARSTRRLAFGHVAEPGTYMTTVTRPDLFGNYLRQQIGLLIQNHGVRSMSARPRRRSRCISPSERCRGAGAAGRRDVLPPARRVRRAGPPVDP
jgi:hypothetical protein